MSSRGQLRIAASEQTHLEGAGLDSFEALWQVAAVPVDTGNTARGGNSTVSLLELPSPEGPRRYYLKRQTNFNCRTPRHWWRGIPVAQREWQAIGALRQRGIATLEVAACGRDRRRGDDRALLLTPALDGYQELDAWLAANVEPQTREQLAEAIGALLAALHEAGWRHGCLYPKHLFVAREFAAGAARIPLRLIDLEKCKRIYLRRGGLRDFDTLFRHCPALDAALREQLLATYLRARRWSIGTAALAARIAELKR